MPNEFYVEENLSGKQLNHQSASLVVPQIFRNKVSSCMYYKFNLTPASLRGDTIVELIPVIVRDFGTMDERKTPHVTVLGGIEFKCLLMKLINLRPPWEQLKVLLEPHEPLNNKYIAALVLCYMRISYYFLTESNPSEQDISFNLLHDLMKKYILDHRKLKSYSLDMDCWSSSIKKEIKLIHFDELIDWLCDRNEIWGIPLGKCNWCKIWDDEEDDESSSDSDSSSDPRDDSDQI
ncbi:U4/U6-U5 snRNP complex subunit PRP38 [Kluyveromyces lactis]|uniref:Pre-mRNA-splicing factor 38 n=1 Tax=Kluyveromyces lactis (strain ATCC 8585 / CBS 2359 / DSM 70799 / NBRC 1267 / NRRL Y-1140 / WM37) TaxID=284590 RepID=Q6CS55_KLULA|nr:uncharacterized protein KLLA0_D03795g [Kluyveromyces lactis]CAH00330.1 KLLA0D03795p [Kluyveromyces lactis]|eukprot:XP_453234.1 uncharacterized protein KLLA0_D03795g [Kluyveromyces lactis]